MKMRLKLPNGELVLGAKYVKRSVKPRRELTPEEEYARKEAHETKAVIAFGLVLLLFVAFVFYWDAIPHRVNDEEKIATLEAADPEYYADIKADLAAYVEAEQSVEPAKVVFRVDIQNYVYELFDVNIWYQVENGDWYRWRVGWLNLPTDLESTLIREFINPDWEG